MSLLKQNEQIRIESVEQLKQVYEVLKGQWDKEYSINDEINSFTIASSAKWYVNYLGGKIAMHAKNKHCETISFGEFISRVNPEPETTIIESVDGKKYKVTVIEEVVEPMGFYEWFRKVSPDINFTYLDCLDKAVEDYIQYRKTLEQ
jgi:hypothetical protein